MRTYSFCSFRIPHKSVRTHSIDVYREKTEHADDDPERVLALETLMLSAMAGSAAAALGQLHYFDTLDAQVAFDVLCFRALRGWMEPAVPENYFQLRPEYIPGDLDFDPFGLRPEDPEECKEMQTKELQHCRLAMLAAVGMIVQELRTGATLF